MSMPEFPEFDPEMTCDYALNMILASIAMEELALSHIINAEGEKLQYILGTLETNSHLKPTIKEILSVNQSVTNLLDSISQNQMILKNKMDKALQGLAHICPGPAPEGPAGPRGPRGECGKQGPEGKRGPQGLPGPCGKISHKCSAVFKGIEKCHLWRANSALHWGLEFSQGSCACIDHCNKAKIKFLSTGRFMINIAVNLKPKDFLCNASVSLKMINGHKCKEIYTVHNRFSRENTLATMSMSGIIIEVFDHCEPSFLELKLISPNSLILDNSMLSIVEL